MLEKGLKAGWLDVCGAEDLLPGAGVCALVEGGQVAIFQDQLDGEVFAIGNHDPIAGANVLSRGIIGSVGERPVVASPLFKQHYCLRSGQCLEDESVRLPCWQARLEQGRVQLRTEPLP